MCLGCKKNGRLWLGTTELGVQDVEANDSDWQLTGYEIQQQRVTFDQEQWIRK